MIDQYWLSSSATTDRFQYAYDQDANALYKNNLVLSSLSELYHANSTSSGDNALAYDKLNRLNNANGVTVTEFQRGTLSVSTGQNNGASGLGSLDTVATLSGLASHVEGWSLDALGNWTSQAIDGTATSRTTIPRTKSPSSARTTSPSTTTATPPPIRRATRTFMTHGID